MGPRRQKLYIKPNGERVAPPPPPDVDEGGDEKCEDDSLWEDDAPDSDIETEDVEEVEPPPVGDEASAESSAAVTHADIHAKQQRKRRGHLA